MQLLESVRSLKLEKNAGQKSAVFINATFALVLALQNATVSHFRQACDTFGNAKITSLQYFTMPPHSIWNPYGMDIFHGIHMESMWNMFYHINQAFTTMDSIWIPYTFHMEYSIWNPHGIHMESILSCFPTMFQPPN
jgi:hypothetical protein